MSIASSDESLKALNAWRAERLATLPVPITVAEAWKAGAEWANARKAGLGALRRPWTRVDEDRLTILFCDGWSTAKLAVEFDRTELSIRFKIGQLRRIGVAIPKRGKHGKDPRAGDVAKRIP